jgi:oligo-1,6-glucosidase
LKRPWWKEAVVYQVYPQSFMDLSGDGIGDLRGITSKLDYLKYLGVDVLWLCPIYDSPNDDNGYDIRDYKKIMNEFGTMADFDELLFTAHQKGLKIILDLVVNHTSDEHPWFVESKSSIDNPYRTYYIWHDQPNDWQSAFGGSAWQYEAKTNQYYLHLFSKKQPDLNWENEHVRSFVYEMMRFWLDKGIDGFRMDVINFISKSFTKDYFMNGPRVHEFLQEMNEEVLCHYDVMTVGETPCVLPYDAALYTGQDRKELNMVFQFEHVDLDSVQGRKWDIRAWRLTELKQVMTKWQEGLHGVGWNSLYMNNHDQPRMVSRFGNDSVYRVESAKMLATFLHMMQGTPYIYQGEEIGMTNVKFDSITDYRDIEILNLWHSQVVEQGVNPDDVLHMIHKKGRDNARTPMQWDGSAHAGFTAGVPWISVNPNYSEINVEQDLASQDSILHYYRKLIQLRKEHDIIVEGRYELILPDDEQVYAYLRVLQEQMLLVILNFSSETPKFHLPENIHYQRKKLIISNYQVDEDADIETFSLRPYEARVYILNLNSIGI